MTIAHGSVPRVGRTRLAVWAVGTAAAGAVLYAVGMATLGWVGFDANDEDFATWQLVVISTGLGGSILAGVAGFVLAVIAKLRHVHWAPLWFPLLFGPVLVISFPMWFE